MAEGGRSASANTRRKATTRKIRSEEDRRRGSGDARAHQLRARAAQVGGFVGPRDDAQSPRRPPAQRARVPLRVEVDVIVPRQWRAEEVGGLLDQSGRARCVRFCIFAYIFNYLMQSCRKCLQKCQRSQCSHVAFLRIARQKVFVDFELENCSLD